MAEALEQYEGPVQQYIASSNEVVQLVSYLVESDAILRGMAPPKTTSELGKHLPLLLELLFQRFVDNFLKFITDLLTLIFTKRPEMLASEEKISYREVLEYDSKAELLSALVDRKIVALSFKGLKELSEDLDRKYGFVLFESPADLERASILVEKRNLITHNQARIQDDQPQSVSVAWGWGLNARKLPRPQAGGEKCLLTFPLIGLPRTAFMAQLPAYRFFGAPASNAKRFPPWHVIAANCEKHAKLTPEPSTRIQR